MIFIIKEQCMDCLSKKLFKHFKTHYGKHTDKCYGDFESGDFKKIIVSISKNLIIEPEEFLNILLIKSAHYGVECFKDEKIERIKLYDKCVYITKKYKIELPKDVEMLIDNRKQKVSLYNKIK